MTIQPKKIFFPNLDGLRFIAFLFVFFEHILWDAFKDLDIEKDSLLRHVLYNFFCNGGFGVSIFFVLSGFLITYLLLTEVQMNGKVDVKAFYMRRFLRIWPLYYAVLIFVFWLYPFVQHSMNIYQENCARPEYYFLFLSNFDLIHIARNCYEQGTMQSGVTWSVAIEEQFYLIWPLLFFFLPKNWYKYVFFSLILVSMGYRIMHHNDTVLIYFHTLGVIGDLALGGLMAWYALHSKRFIGFFENIRPVYVYTIYICGFVIAMAGDHFFPSTYYTALSRYINIAYFAFVICHQNFNKTDSLKLSRLKYFTKWGKYTYGMYLLHPIGSIIGTFIFKRVHHYEDSFLVDLSEGIGIFVITSFLAYFSFHYFESYFLTLKKRFSYIVKN